MKYFFRVMASPVGALLPVVNEAGALVSLRFMREDGVPELMDLPGLTGLSEDFERTAPVSEQLEEYFAGRRTHFSLTLAPEGTAFQKAVWQALLDIPYGETWSYLQVAERLGKPGSVRAVGQANGANPIPIVVPCHRVIGANQTLTGYGGGIPTKVKLLALEGFQVFGDKVYPPGAPAPVETQLPLGWSR